MSHTLLPGKPRERVIEMLLRTHRRARPEPLHYLEREKALSEMCASPGWRTRLNAALQRAHRPGVESIESRAGFAQVVAQWSRRWSAPMNHLGIPETGRRWCSTPEGPTTPWEAVQLKGKDDVSRFIEALWIARQAPRRISLSTRGWRWRWLYFPSLEREGLPTQIKNPVSHPEWTQVVDDLVRLWRAGVRDVRDLDAALR